MNRRQLFLSTAKAALLSALGGLGFSGGAKAQLGEGANGGFVREKLYKLIGRLYGAPGSPTATLNIPGDQLPPPPQPFGGSIELNAAQSQSYWPMRVVPPQSAPNILLILTDDVGFAAPSTFGGVIPTPTLDRVACQGN
jgi:arylsulfatase